MVVSDAGWPAFVGCLCQLLTCYLNTPFLPQIEVDLRWGVPKDSSSEATLRACLGELDRCRRDNTHPFFLNLLGDRYGWVPSAAALPPTLAKEYDWVPGLSVTHMEVCVCMWFAACL